MLFTRLYKILDFIPTEQVDTWLVDISLNGDLNIKLDHGRALVLFQKAAEMRLMYKVKTVSSSLYEVNKLITGTSQDNARIATQERLIAQFNFEEEKAIRAEKQKQASEFAVVRRADMETTQKQKRVEAEEKKQTENTASN